MEIILRAKSSTDSRVEEAEGEAGSHTALLYLRTSCTIDLYRERRVDGEELE